MAGFLQAGIHIHKNTAFAAASGRPPVPASFPRRCKTVTAVIDCAAGWTLGQLCKLETAPYLFAVAATLPQANKMHIGEAAA